MAAIQVVQLRGSLANRSLDRSNHVGGTAMRGYDRPDRVPSRASDTLCSFEGSDTHLRDVSCPPRSTRAGGVTYGPGAQPNYRWRTIAGKRNLPGTGDVP